MENSPKRHITGGYRYGNLRGANPRRQALRIHSEHEDDTLCASTAKQGVRIAWPIWAGGGFVAPVVAQLPNQIEPEVYPTGDALREVLNPVAYVS